MSKTIQDHIKHIEKSYAGTTQEYLLDLWRVLADLQESLTSSQVVGMSRWAKTVEGHDNLKKEVIDLWDYLHKQERPEPILQVKLIHPNAKVPTRGSDGAIGWDLYVNDVVRSPLLIPAGDRLIVDTGISVAIPHGYYGRIAPRSGLAAKQGIDVLAGVVDEDYRGEVKVIIYNTTHNHAIVDQTKPIAQLILERADIGKLMVVEELLSTVRGSGGFGSSDNKEINKDETTQTS